MGLDTVRINSQSFLPICQKEPGLNMSTGSKPFNYVYIWFTSVGFHFLVLAGHIYIPEIYQ